MESSLSPEQESFLRNLDVLVCGEVYLGHCERLTAADQAMRNLRLNDLPFRSCLVSTLGCDKQVACIISAKENEEDLTFRTEAELQREKSAKTYFEKPATKERLVRCELCCNERFLYRACNKTSPTASPWSR